MCKTSCFACCDIHTEKMTFSWRDFEGVIVDVLSVVGEILDIGVDACEACECVGFERIEVEIIVTIAIVGCVDESVVVEEDDWLVWFEKVRVSLREKCGFEFACDGIVGVEVQGFLLTIHDLDIDSFAIRRPSRIGEIAFGSKVGDVEIDSLVLRHVVYAEFEAFGWHTDHWVFDVAGGASASCDVEEREGGDTGFVFDIEGDATIVGRREDACHTTKLVARNGLSADNIFIIIGSDWDFDTIGSEPCDIVVF